MSKYRFVQQPAEIISYDVDFGPWVTDRNDSVVSFIATAEAGITIESSRDANVVKVKVSGGTNGSQYKVTVRATTADGLVKEAEFSVRIKDS
jgi:hypothetical protein